MLSARTWLSLAVLVGMTGACKKGLQVDVEVSTGQEHGSLSLDPKITRVDLVGKTVDGKTTVKASAAPGGSFDLGEVSDGVPFVFDVKGVGADGTTLAEGRTVDVDLSNIVSGTIPIFLQRLGGFARPVGAIPTTHVHGLGAVFLERFLLLSGGDAAADAAGASNTKLGDFYDLLTMGGKEGGVFPRNPGVLVVRGNSVFVADEMGGTWVDLSTTSQSEVAAPDGAAFADVVNGRAIETETGDTWIVGATRDGPPSAAILVVGSDSTLSARTLGTPRAGAAATWIAGVGLVVYGGSDTAEGVEIIPTTGASSTLPYPADATKGAALATLQNDQAVLVGGILAGAPSPTRTLDLRCVSGTGCVAQPIDGATVDNLATRTQAFAVNGGFIAVGDDVNGQTRAFRVIVGAQTPSSTELPLREPRLGATAVAAPNGTLAILGGQLLSGGPATSVESYFPE